MNLITKSILSIGLLAFVATQLYLTIFGGFLWPFSSHRLFSQLSTPRKTIVQAVLVDSNNNTYTVHPGRVVPIEYSRCSGLIRNMCTKGSPEQKRYLHNYLLTRLNQNPWYPFDEMFGSVRSIDNAPFVTLSFEHHLIEFDEHHYPNSIITHQRTILFP